MKKQLSSTINNQGFMVPYVMFIIAIALMAITTSVNIYKDEIQITYNQLEQTKLETLFQMAHTTFKEEISLGTDIKNPVYYQFPYGDVRVEYIILSEKEYHLYFTITTKNGSDFTTTNRIFVDKE